MKNRTKMLYVVLSLLAATADCSAMEQKIERNIQQEWRDYRFKTHITTFEELSNETIESIIMDEAREHIILVPEKRKSPSICTYHPATKKQKKISPLQFTKNSTDTTLSIDITRQEIPRYITPSALGLIFKTFCQIFCHRFYEQNKMSLARDYYTSSSKHDFFAPDNQGCILMKTIKDEQTHHTLCSMYIDDKHLNFNIKPLCTLMPSTGNNEITFVSPHGTLIAHYNNQNQKLTVFTLLEPGFTFGKMYDTNFAYN